MRLIANDFICRKDEREYIFPSKVDANQFKAFMINLGFNCSGLYISDNGYSIIFY